MVEASEGQCERLWDLLGWLAKGYAAFLPGGEADAPAGLTAQCGPFFCTLQDTPQRLEAPPAGAPTAGDAAALLALSRSGRVRTYKISPAYAASLSRQGCRSADPLDADDWDGGSRSSAERSSAGY